jgi:hypothetical protein
MSPGAFSCTMPRMSPAAAALMLTPPAVHDAPRVAAAWAVSAFAAPWALAALWFAALPLPHVRSTDPADPAR